MTTVAEWLATREPVPPPALRARVLSALGDRAGVDRGHAAEVCLAAGEATLTAVLQDGSTRSCALGLLAADALVTYAFEAAAETPTDLAQFAARAMHRIAALGAEPAGDPGT